MTRNLADSLLDWRVWLTFLSLQVPSLRALFKYLPSGSWPIAVFYFSASFAVCVWLVHPPRADHRLENLLKKSWLIPALFLVLTCVNVVIYPIADARKTVGQGSDQDDALIQAATRLIHGHNPYESGTDLYSHPLSPGPGWVMLTAPLSLSHLYVLLTPLCATLAAYLIARQSRNLAVGTKLLLLLMSSLAFWELMVSGSDMLAIACLFVAAWFACFEAAGLGIWPMLTAAVYLGLMSTSRVLFVYVVPLFAVLLFRRRIKSAVITLIVGLIVTIGLHAVFYLWNPDAYSPLHILGKGEALMPPGLMILALIACVATTVFTVLRARGDLQSGLLLLWLCLAVPLLFASLGDLMSQSWNFARWEGANYLALLMPLALATVLTRKEPRPAPEP